MTQIILSDPSSVWSESLRRQLKAGASLVEVHRLDDIWEPLRHSPASLVVLEFNPERADETFSALVRLAQEFPLAVPVLAMPPQHSPWEPALREAGAVHVITSLRRASEIVQIALRQAARLRTDLADDPRLPPQPQQSIEERILASLPWGE